MGVLSSNIFNLSLCFAVWLFFFFYNVSCNSSILSWAASKVLFSSCVRFFFFFTILFLFPFSLFLFHCHFILITLIIYSSFYNLLNHCSSFRYFQAFLLLMSIQQVYFNNAWLISQYLFVHFFCLLFLITLNHKVLFSHAWMFLDS